MKKITLILITFLISLSGICLEVIHTKGQVLLNTQPIIKNSRPQLKVNDKINVLDQDGLAVVRYADGTKVLLKEGQASLISDGSKERKWKLDSGEFFITVKKPNQSESQAKTNRPRFLIQTKSVTMGVRGTKFWVQEDKQESYLCVCEGEVEVKNKHGKTLVKKNEDIRLNSRTKVLKSSPAPRRMIKMAWGGLNKMASLEKSYQNKKLLNNKRSGAKNKEKKGDRDNLKKEDVRKEGQRKIRNLKQKVKNEARKNIRRKSLKNQLRNNNQSKNLQRSNSRQEMVKKERRAQKIKKKNLEKKLKPKLPNRKMKNSPPPNH